MSDRLTAAERTYPRWISWIPWILLAGSLAGLAAGGLPVWEMPEHTGSGAARLQSAAVRLLGPERAAWVHLPFLAVLLAAAGSLARRLLPAKTPLPPVRLAQALGIVFPAAALMLHREAVWTAAPALPAMALLFAGWAVFLHALSAKNRQTAAGAGLLLGLAAGLDPLIAPGVLPPLVQAGAGWLRKQPGALPRTVLLLAGLIAGLLIARPELPAITSAFDWRHPLQALRETGMLFGIAGAVFMLLALLVGTLQKNTVLLGLLLAAHLLQKAVLGLSGTPSPERLAALSLIPALLLAYGLFRLLRGIESGVHSVQPARAKWVAPSLLVLLLILFKIWTLTRDHLN